MNQTAKGSGASQAAGASVDEAQTFCLGLCGVRYQVRDVSRSVAFYPQKLGFNLDQQSHCQRSLRFRSAI